MVGLIFGFVPSSSEICGTTGGSGESVEGSWGGMYPEPNGEGVACICELAGAEGAAGMEGEYGYDGLEGDPPGIDGFDDETGCGVEGIDGELAGVVG